MQQKTADKMTCEFCNYSLPAQNSKVVGCKFLHSQTIKPQDVSGDVYEGWYGQVMLVTGYVVSKTASCKYFEAKEV